VLGACLLVRATLLLRGCSNPGSPHPVDPPRARDALKTALDEWKKGENPQSLASASTPIIVQDFDWTSGAKLIDYQLVDDGKAIDANLSIQVIRTYVRPVPRTWFEGTGDHLGGAWAATSESATVPPAPCHHQSRLSRRRASS
jgi:hypothetical protein